MPKNSSVAVTIKKARRSAYNLTLRCVRANVVAVEKQQVLHIVCVCVRGVCSLSYSACGVLLSCLMAHDCPLVIYCGQDLFMKKVRVKKFLSSSDDKEGTQ